MAKKKNSQNKINKNVWLALAVGVLIGIVGAWALGISSAAPAKGSGGKTGGSSSSLSIKMVTDQNSDGMPNYADTITFTVSTSATNPYVVLNCYQNGNVVYQHQVGFYSGYPWSQNYILSSNSWTSGAANCTASLEYNSHNKAQVLTTLQFSVGA